MSTLCLISSPEAELVAEKLKYFNKIVARATTTANYTIIQEHLKRNNTVCRYHNIDASNELSTDLLFNKWIADVTKHAFHNGLNIDADIEQQLADLENYKHHKMFESYEKFGH